jgi:anthranilate phosphoribosyltransferase
MTERTWPQLLSDLLNRIDLDREGANWAMREIMSGNATGAQLGAFMLALRAKGETVAELAGMVDIMLENAVLLETGSDAVDIVGTGGDLVGTVNISSMASVVAAAAGVPVLKHGSRSASGKTGSSEMLEVLGIRLDLAPAQVAEVFQTTGITFFFAPVFHPAMRHVAPVRKELGVPTTFNFLGPLANPAQPIATALGVANQSIAPLMASELAARGRSGLVFRSEDGLDELSTTASNQLWQVSRGSVTELTLDASDLGLERANVKDLVGGDARHNAEVALAMFDGESFRNMQQIRDVTLLNAAAGLVSYELAKNPETSTQNLTERFRAALNRSEQALVSGAARETLVRWSAATQQYQ